MRVDQARQLKELEQENSRLKKLVADLSLDNSILKEVAWAADYENGFGVSGCDLSRQDLWAAYI